MEVCIFGRARALLLVALASGACLSANSSPAATPEKATDTRRGLATEAVREALQHEVYGLADERSRLLREAAEHDPQFEAARWLSGQVRDDHGKWLDHEQINTSPGLSEKLAEYEKIRDKYPDTVDGHLTIASWCAKRKLVPQQRAHLMRVIDLAPEHAEAREKLGFVRLDGSWVSREELAAERIRAAHADRDLKTWRPVVQEILKDLRHRSEERQAAAKERLEAIHDPAALPALTEAVFSVSDDEAALILDVLVHMAAPEASLSIAQVAAFSPSQKIREAAAERLGQRKFEEFVPPLLASLYSPVTSRATTALLPNGRLAFRHTFVREGMDQQQVLQLDTQYQRREMVGGNRAESTARAALHALNATARREQAAAMQNAMTQMMNERLMWVLSQATKEQFADPAGWWKWWNERNEVSVGGSKDVAFVQQSQTVQIVDYVPPPPKQSGSKQTGQPSGGTDGGTTEQSNGGRGGSVQLRRFGDCLAAGTQVWTIHGPAAIETVRVGDLLLSRSPETGELTYKPVVKTNVRAKGELVKITIDGESVETSGGHLFWVSGEGWVRARDLQAGLILHGVSNPARVQAVEKGQTAETYNVTVADFSTYFVGEAKILSHDNTVRQPTRAIVPGLRME